MAVARRTGGVIINADASQVYRDLRIITARPTVEDEAEAEHRLYGYIDGAETCSAACWAEDARAEITDVIAQGRLPILTGGTGLYIRTLLYGIAPVPAIDPQVRQDVRALAVADAYAALRVEDTAAAQRLAPADSARVARALEVVRSTGRPLADWQKERTGGIAESLEIAPVIVLPDRAELNDRVERRLKAMFSEGATAEVAALLRRTDVPSSAPILRAIGVADVADLLRGDIREAEAASRIALATKQYAKRQYTWFRHQLPPDWRRETTASTDNLKDYFAKVA